MLAILVGALLGDSLPLVCLTISRSDAIHQGQLQLPIRWSNGKALQSFLQNDWGSNLTLQQTLAQATFLGAPTYALRFSRTSLVSACTASMLACRASIEFLVSVWTAPIRSRIIS